MMSRFIICRASAGSGKTYALVRQYIEIAISSPSQLERRFGHTLAITFTNKAANGMKKRIMATLDQIVTRHSDSEKLVAEMSEHLSIDCNETIRRCSVVYSSIMHHYSDFAVCTIDSFVHRLVRTFAHDLNLPLNFNLLIEKDEILQFSVDELLSLAGSDGSEPLTRVLCAFAESRLEEGQNYHIESMISDLAEKIFSEEAPRFMDRLKDMDFDRFLALREQWLKENRIFEQQMSKIAREALDVCQRHGLGVNDMPNREKGVYGWFKRIANGDCSAVGKNAYVYKFFEEGVHCNKTAPAQLRNAIESAVPELTQCYEQLKQTADKGMTLYNTRQLILPRLYAMALLNRIRKIKDDYYKETDTVHISEFNKRIAKEIADQPTPFIYERIGSRYYNYLIDEFQDTSKMQWNNFLPLLDEAMSHRFSDDTAPAGMQSLVVGDGKQAIYRFRQGDVRQFIRLPKVDSSLHGDSLQYNAHFEDLDTNWRSLKNIIEFNNRFFEWAVKNHFPYNEDLVRLYIGDGSHERPLLYQNSLFEGGYVDVEFHDADRLYQELLNVIRHQVDDLGYGYGDIMVLARENKTLVQISDYIIANSPDKPIPMVSSESFILANSMVVMLLFSMLKYLSDSDNKALATQVVQYATQLRCLHVGDESEILWQLCEAKFDLETVLCNNGVAINAEYLRSLSLYDCCEEMLRLFNLHGRESSYVATFLDSVMSFASRHRSDIGEFVNFFEERIYKVSSSTVGDVDAVNLMTIHKAKGLEGKVVIYVLPKLRPHGQKLWVEVPQESGIGIPVAYVDAKKDSDTLFSNDFREEELMGEMDRVNLLYVAMTRPEEKLIVLCENKYKAGNNDDISLLYQFSISDTNFVSDGNRFTIGDDFQKPSSDDASAPSSLILDDVVFPSWENRIGIAAQSEALLSAFDSDSRRYGIIVHDLLSHIFTADDVDRVVDDYCREQRLDAQVKADICSRIMSMIDKEENRKYFAPGNRVLCETSIAIDGKVRRPDRIVFADGQTWVVDFKTGTYSDTMHQHYQDQVDEYVSAVAAMGYPNVTGAILYL